MKRINLDNRIWSTWTSLFFLFPAMIALQQDKTALFYLFSFVALSSTYYHLKKPHGVDWWWRKKSTEQHVYQIIDTVFGVLTGVYLFVEIYKQGVTVLSVLVSIIILIAFLAFLYTEDNYNFNHGIWHIAISAAVTYVLLFA